MKAFTDTIIAYKLAWIRVAFYFLIPAGTLFLTQTETFSDQTWNGMGGFLKSRLVLQCCIAGASALAAYLDSSFQRAQDSSRQLKAQRDAETSFTKIKLDPTKP